MGNPKKNIVWLASYPKSGNTWFRIFLSNLRSESDVPVDINEIQTNGIFSSKAIFEKATGIDASHLTPKEADELRSDVFRYYSSRIDDMIFIKAHDAYTYLPNGDPLFPSDVSYGAIYFVRNPWDVAVSWAFHNGKNATNAHTNLNKNTIIAKQNGYANQLQQQLPNWSKHIESWIGQSNIPVLLLRYEDMKNESLATFRKAVQFLGWEHSDEEILEALKKSSFKQLKKQEEEKGFNERLRQQKQFFRSGTVGDWKNHLSETQEDAIKEAHLEVIKKLKYF